jgi:hypothetical protein
MLYRVSRAAALSEQSAPVIPVDVDALASLQRHFGFDVKAILPPLPMETTNEDGATGSTSTLEEFNLFSTGAGPAKVSITEQTYEVPLVNRCRPREHYFTDPYVLSSHQLNVEMM